MSVLRYLVSKFREDRRLFDQPVRELGIGTFTFNGQTVVSVREETSLIDTLDLLARNRISCVPVVSEDNVVLDIYCRSYVT